MTWGSDLFQAILVFGLLVVTGCVALFVDYLKSYNDQLRERNIALSVRQQEREKWFGANPEAFIERIAGLLRSSQPLAVPAPVSGVSVRHRSRAAARVAADARAAAGSDIGAAVQDAVAELPEAVLRTQEEQDAPEIAPLSPRARARRDTAPAEGWVSKEELERLAERAARIRARYGNMVQEEGPGAAKAPEEAAAPIVPEPAPADIAREMGADLHIGNIEEHVANGVEHPVHRSEEVTSDSSGPALRSLPAGEPAPEEQMPALVPLPKAAAMPTLPSGMLRTEAADHERFEASPEPVFGLPASPAQSAISTAVAPRSAPETSQQASRLHDPSAAESRSQDSTQSSAAEPTALASHESQIALATAPELTNEPQDPDLDALFDQTYGSPAWLAANSPSSTQVDSVLPTGLFEGSELATLLSEAPPFTGVAVSIRINDFAQVKPKLNTVEGVEAMTALSNLIRSLLREDRDFAGKSQEDEYVLLFPGETGDEGQRRLFHLSERLWDFQLRSLGGLSLMLSWGGLEVDSRPVPEAISAARDRLEESRRGRARPGNTFRSARRAS